MNPHRIRLRGPWQCEILSRLVAAEDGSLASVAVEEPLNGAVAVPGDLAEVAGPGFSGQARLSRAFHRPTGLDPHERVWLMVDAAGSEAIVALNGQTLGAAAAGESPAAFDITERLAPDDVVTLELTHRPQDAPGQVIGPVWLEIRPG